jgi:pimeloyl-ACP methyl ester carboxylesterase
MFTSITVGLGIKAEAAPLVPTDCKVTGLKVQTRCFELTVPENRAKPSSKPVKLFVAVLKSRSSNPKPDPVIYLPGGPGGSASASIEAFAELPILADRDLILMDPRGTGRSQPILDCPEIPNARASVFTAKSRPRPFQEFRSQLQTASRQCAARLRAANIDLSSYNTIELANDVAALRQALGIREWNLLGTSYGTRVALEVMRSHPKGVRSVILDSAYPPNVFNTATAIISDAQQALNNLLARCQADQACNRRFPRLRQQLATMVERYNRQPYKTQFAFADRSVDGEITGSDLLAAVASSLFDTNAIPSLPLTIERLSMGDNQLIEDSIKPILIGIGTPLPLAVTDGAFPVVTCVDEQRVSSRNDRALASGPGIYSTIAAVGVVDCASWNVKSAPAAFNQPVRSNIPTLLVAGSFDPTTLPQQTRDVGRYLPRSKYVELPNGGHVPSLGSACGQSVVGDFLSRPLVAPNIACTRSLGVQFQEQ